MVGLAIGASDVEGGTHGDGGADEGVEVRDWTGGNEGPDVNAVDVVAILFVAHVVITIVWIRKGGRKGSRGKSSPHTKVSDAFLEQGEKDIVASGKSDNSFDADTILACRDKDTLHEDRENFVLEIVGREVVKDDGRVFAA